MTEPIVHPAAYWVNVLPEDFPDSYHWTIKLEYRGRGLWAIIHSMQVYGHDGTWDWEPSPSTREEIDGWLENYRWTLEEAIDVAKQLAPTVKVMGRTAEQWRQESEQNVDGLS